MESSAIFTPEKSKKIALARLDLLNQWKEFRKKSGNKLQADYDFVNLHNTSNSHLFEVLGKISSNVKICHILYYKQLRF